MTGLAFQKYERNEPRSIVNKLVPGYVQSMNFDIKATSPTIQVEGILVGTSAANLASQISTLKAMHRSKKLVWIDASDQYQGLCDFVRISKLNGPTIDSSKGPLVANFSLEAIALLPWGTTLLNPYNTTGVVLRDLSGVGLENVLNPLSMNCNFILSSALQSNQGGNSSNWFSWEFILDNQNPFSGSQSIINECDSASGFYDNTGGETNPTFTVDNVNFKQGAGSVRCSATAASQGQIGAGIGFTAQNWSAYDFLVLWLRSDFGGASSGSLTVFVKSSSTSYWAWSYGSCSPNVWYRLVIPLRNPTSTTGTPSLSSVTNVEFQSGSGNTGAWNTWIDEIAVDVGSWVNLEFMLPDNVALSVSESIQANSWTGSAYSLCLAWGEPPYSNWVGNTLYYLDGSEAYSDYGGANSYGRAMYALALVGANATLVFSNTQNVSEPATLAMTTAYGSNNRILFGVYMPPATSDSNSGNYPSDDLLRFQAINKARIKVQVYYSNEDTSYSGM